MKTFSSYLIWVAAVYTALLSFAWFQWNTQEMAIHQHNLQKEADGTATVYEIRQIMIYRRRSVEYFLLNLGIPSIVAGCFLRTVIREIPRLMRESKGK